MAFTILGPGLVGSLLGAAAAAQQVLTGPSGRIRARRARLPAGTYHWQPRVVTTLDPQAPVLVTCRTPDTPWERLGPQALVAQNGLGQPRPTIACFLAVDQDAEGTVHWTGPRPRLVLDRPAPCWEPVLAAWSDAGIQVEVVADAEAARWEKAILNATVGPLCLATGLPMAAVWADLELRQLVLTATTEGRQIAAAHGVAIRPGLRDRTEAFFAQTGGHRPSLLDDPRELPWVLDVLLDRAAHQALAAQALAAIGERCRSALAAGA
jgi:ketopantoate reductase